MKISILIAAHKPYQFPKNEIYMPIEVGASLRQEHFLPQLDNVGDNISLKNPSFCELTALYWGWKNCDCDILGLVHYRRYFINRPLCFSKNFDHILTKADVEKALTNSEIILPKKRHYFIETNYSHYCHAHIPEALNKTEEIIRKDFPDYYSAFQTHMKRRSGHYFTMFICKKEIANSLLEWMFAILFKLEKNINLSKYEGPEKRVFGYVSELLFDVFCLRHNLKIKNQKYLFLENNHWLKKIFSFMKRKLTK